MAEARWGDRDGLIETFRSVHDFVGEEEPGEEELRQLARDPANRDYKQVLHRYVTETLKEQTLDFQTTSRSQNPRTVLVTTASGRVYHFHMKKLHSHGGVWLVEKYAMGEPDNGNVAVSNAYREIRMDDAPTKVQKWAKGVLNRTPGWATDSFIADGKSYALVKTSASPHDSVELEDILIFTGEATVKYQTYAKQQEQLIQDYLLVEIDWPGGAAVQFWHTVHFTSGGVSF